MFFNKTTEPSLEDRLVSATLIGGSARAQFLDAANELDKAADDLDILAQDTQNALDDLVGIFEAAIEDSDANRSAAKRLRSLVGPNQLTLF